MERRSCVEPCLSDMVDPILHGSFLFGRQMVQRAAIKNFNGDILWFATTRNYLIGTLQFRRDGICESYWSL